MRRTSKIGTTTLILCLGMLLAIQVARVTATQHSDVIAQEGSGQTGESKQSPDRFYSVQDRDFFELTHQPSADGYLAFFGADWCGHCKHFKPIFTQMASRAYNKEYKTNPVLIHYRVDDRDLISTMFNIAAFPTLVYIKGDKWCKFKGNRTEEHVMNWVHENQMDGEDCQKYTAEYPSRLEQWIITAKDVVWQLKEEYKYYNHVYPTATMIVCGFMIFCIMVILFGMYLCIHDMFVGAPNKQPNRGDHVPKKQGPAKTAPAEEPKSTEAEKETKKEK